MTLAQASITQKPKPQKMEATLCPLSRVACAEPFTILTGT
jgi:hypothetical protein